jgi:hypothetical protein
MGTLLWLFQVSLLMREVARGRFPRTMNNVILAVTIVMLIAKLTLLLQQAVETAVMLLLMGSQTMGIVKTCGLLLSLTNIGLTTNHVSPNIVMTACVLSLSVEGVCLKLRGINLLSGGTWLHVITCICATGCTTRVSMDTRTLSMF